MGHWEQVRYKIDESVYVKTKVGIKTRKIYGAALDDFNTDLDDLEAKKAEIERVTQLIANKEDRERLSNNMTSTASFYEKLKNAVLYERSLLPATVNAVFDSFVSDVSLGSPLDSNSESFRNAIALVEQLRRQRT
jgi:hypothetical protein